MDAQKQRLLNQRIIRKKVCKECHGRLVEKHVGGRDVVVCGQDETHEGFVDEQQALLLVRQQRRDAIEVLANYPQLKGPETAEQSTTTLFG